MRHTDPSVFLQTRTSAGGHVSCPKSGTNTVAVGGIVDDRAHTIARANLLRELRLLHRRAGEPSTREIAKAAGVAVISHSTVAAVLRGADVPRWDKLALVVSSLGGDIEVFRHLWIEARNADLGAGNPVGQPDAPDPTDQAPFDQERGFEQQALLLRQRLLDGLSVGNVLRAWESKEANTEVMATVSPRSMVRIDLVKDGPHGLIAGTTGSGKTQLLRTLITTLALEASPAQLNFILFDYRGGSAFRRAAELPHVAHYITELSARMCSAVLNGLEVEMGRRHEMLHRAHVSSFDAYQACPVAAESPLARVVIVVEEFAGIKFDHPVFFDRLLAAAQAGRNLGFHLLLGTQRPGGAVDRRITTMTELRVALRMADVSDSIDVIGTPDAANIDWRYPGRAYLRKRGGVRELVQVVDISVHASQGHSTAVEPLDRIVDTIIEANRSWDPHENIRAGIISSLRDAYDIATLPTPRRDDELIFAVSEDFGRRLTVEAFRPDRDGNLAVYGTGGSGKSVVLRTIAISAGYAVHTPPCQVYGVDNGINGLRMLDKLPHVTSVVDGTDLAGIHRLLGGIMMTLRERTKRQGEVGAGDFKDYRMFAHPKPVPRILLLIDSFGRGTWPPPFVSIPEEDLELLRVICSTGRTVGIHVVLSADSSGYLAPMIAQTFQRRVVLRLADANEATRLGVNGDDALTHGAPPGRGVLDGKAIQVAILGGASALSVQANAVERFADAMRRART